MILAAGASTRMGSPKQLLAWKGTTLLGYAIEQAQKLDSEIFVVLGANFSKIKASIKHYPIHVLNNKQWEKGLGSSIAFGVNYMLKNKLNFDAILIMLADQPLINENYLRTLIHEFSTKKSKIVASLYENDKQGVPVLFDKIYFDELSNLNDDKGAKALLKKHANNVSLVNAEAIVSDIDTLEEYQKLYDAIHKNK